MGQSRLKGSAVPDPLSMSQSADPLAPGGVGPPIRLAMANPPEVPPAGSFPPGKTKPTQFLSPTREPPSEQGGAPAVRSSRGSREAARAVAAGLGKEEAAYIGRLEDALGSEAFMPIYEQLKADKAVNPVAIANHFYGPVAPSTPRQKALDRILTRHRKVAEF